ncbi:MAG: asparagine synthetase B [Bacteroidetes bacterium]|nr:asparagine synthetase B [Bacteroidota bacterium]MCL5266952.1 asparagine synthetase B [Bacteroidota bacterium]
MKKLIFMILVLFTATAFAQSKLFIYMDLKQTNDLKAYGVAYYALEHGIDVDWLLNYRGGSFMMDYNDVLANECRIRGVAFDELSAAQASEIYAVVQDVDNNMDVVRLEKAPKIAVYIPPNYKPWDDAVTLALNYAQIPYTQVWDQDVLDGKINKFDWLHLHHEDFTGQYGKFYGTYANAPWYQEEVATYEKEAHRLGFKKVSDEKKAVAEAIKQYVGRGGFLFAMCSATETLDIALAAQHVDICDAVFDGDPPDPHAQEKLDYANCLAFQNFKLIENPYVYGFSNINDPANDMVQFRDPSTDYFTLFKFSAKYDPVPTMLTQDQVNVIHNFMGQTTSFRKSLIKPDVIIMGQKEGTQEVKYIHGDYGKGTWTFLGGHDPAAYEHLVGDPPTDLSLHKNSPGYRLILNNILFPAAQRKPQKT